MRKAHNYQDLTGKKFGRLTALKDIGRSNLGRVLWLCRCDCGKEKAISANHIKNLKTLSCGCLQKEKARISGLRFIHKMTKTAVYKRWTGMKNRCYNPKNKDYSNYGGRGITICERWLNSFVNFLNDMGDRPSLTYSIDRIDNNGNYEPTNCRWATASTQAKNRRLRNRDNNGRFTKRL